MKKIKQMKKKQTKTADNIFCTQYNLQKYSKIKCIQTKKKCFDIS